MASKNLIFPILLFSILCNESSAQQTTNNNGSVIAVGSSLTATENSSPWLSPSGDFAFGFRKVNATSEDQFLLCIWFARLSDQTIVWFANKDHSPATTPRGSTLNVTSDHGIVLTDPGGGESWRSESILGQVSSAAMTDQGNFVLRDTSSATLWQSFNFPTDTLLPSQTLGRGGSLWSRQSETSFERGKFRLLLQQDGNLVLASINLPTEYQNQPYFATATDGSSTSSPGKQVVFNATSNLLYVSRENGETVSVGDGVLPARQSQFYWRATLGFDGVLSLYRCARSGGSWDVVWSEPDNICLSLRIDSGLGICGYNSICRLKENERKPYCECPRGYSLADPGDSFGDCRPDFVHGCPEDGDGNYGNATSSLYDVEVLINIDWPTSDYMLFRPFTAELCRESCLDDCLCSVAIFRDNTCWKKKLPLSNGRLDTTLDSRAFLKVRKPEFSTLVPHTNQTDNDNDNNNNNNNNRKDNSALFITSVAANVLLLGAAICVGLFCLFGGRRGEMKKLAFNSRTSFRAETNLYRFAYTELENATSGFKEELGRGAFGVVYKGDIGVTAVAVKKLSHVGPETEKEFKNEVDAIGRTHHKNLVELLGYCDDGKSRLLVYEYLSKGTLANYLFSKNKPSWKERTEIAIGTARGLVYLHEECGGTQVIHCDVKPQNILLDESNNPRISDFGLAKLLMADQTRTSTMIRGTKGYVAPEWFRNAPVTAKVDVYSFGVVLLEIVCCRRNIEMSDVEATGKEILTDWAYDCYKEGSLEALVDWDDEALEDRERLERFVMVSMWCVQENPFIRPNMRRVLQMLEGLVQLHVPPCPYVHDTSFI